MLGLLLAPLWVGLPILAGTARLTWRLAEGERRQANRLLEAHIPAITAAARHPQRPRAARRPRLLARVRAADCSSCRSPSPGLAIAAAPAVLAVALAGFGVSGLAGDDGRLVGPWALGPAVGLVLCVLALPATIVSIAALEAVGRGAASARPHAPALARRRSGPGARDARRAPRRPLAEHRLLAARARDLRRRRRSPGRAARPGLRPHVDGGRPRRASAWRRSSTTPSSTPSPELVTAAAAAAGAGDRQRAPEGRAARPRGGAAGVAAADRRGRRRRAPADRARPPRRRPAAARLARPGPADAQGAPRRQRARGHRRRDRRQARGGARRAARVRPRHPPGVPLRARASAPPSTRSWPARR